MGEVSVRPVTGADILGVIDDLARLRITVFRDFPYLYDGGATYETRYLARYADDPRALVAVAWDGDVAVGAATAMPLIAHGDASQFRLPEDAPAVSDIYYLAESVLLPEYRGQGIGHQFFDHREAMARKSGFAHAAFAAVMRPTDHPMRPSEYRPLDPFWLSRGYAPLNGGMAEFSWTDVGDTTETTKALQVWHRPL